MITTATMNNSPVRHIMARVELYEGSTLVTSYSYKDALISVTIDRVGEDSKFFGYGICQKANVHLRDVNREISVTTANSMKIYFGADNTYIQTNPRYFVTEVHRDENTNELSITAYDAIYGATEHTVAELGLTSYTIGDFAAACATLLGLNSVSRNPGITAFNTNYEEGANFEGTETIREALDDVAEATQTIYYIDKNNLLVFKKLDIDGDAVLTINKADYITAESSTNRRLATITHATELGDNVTATTGVSGTTQYVRDNAFWDLREDIATLVDNALAAIGGLTINQFDCDWRGNYLLEIGDKIALVTKDDDVVISYVLNDTISYDGAYSQKTLWSFTDNESETAANPTNLGEAIKQTYARVDKQNKEIELVAGSADANGKAISSLILNTDSISASVEKVEKTTNDALEGMTDDIATLTTKVNSTMTAEDVKLEIQTELENGVDKVTTSTGFTFNEEGLTVSKADSEMSTQITEDGMTVSKNNDIVLTANNTGVEAINLKATTYLIIGTNSRFEDYDNRTGCFWIGG